MTRWREGVVQIVEPDGVVDLGPGHLDPALLPTDLLRTAYADAFDDYGPAGLTYGENQGPLPLREALARRVSSADGVPCRADQVVITAGTSTTLDLLARWAVPDADTVVADAFAYDHGMRVFTDRGLDAVRVPMDTHGMVPSALDEALDAAGSGVALVYLLPTFHNPTGLVVPVERRRELIAVARRHGVRIVEDDAYADVVLGPPPPTSVAGLAGYRDVVRLGTFSKSLAPGLRLGWLVTDAATAKGFAESAAFSSGGGLNHLAAVAVAGLLESGAYDRHVVWLREQFRLRRDALVSTLRAHLPPEFRFTTPGGGFFLWVTLPDGVTEEAAVAAAARAGAPVLPGSRFGRGANAAIRLSWSFHGPDRLTEGARRLAGALAGPGPR
ncbi:aminotransferase class I/II-fold pyridoxal phosphate-dependent enzyme [Umezawaea sp.]|uniref:aminotransferase class I/II-fold pyridoxal phosphate-dependent enzyme n=1 Tax=Umezawaea sp. TaxID=1955258 RepID=UPI002ECFEB49